VWHHRYDGKGCQRRLPMKSSGSQGCDQTFEEGVAPLRLTQEGKAGKQLLSQKRGQKGAKRSSKE